MLNSIVRRALRPTLALPVTLFLAACGGDVENPAGTNEQEVITTVTLTFTPNGGGDAVTAAWDDPDGDGGAAPAIDAVTLTASTTYALTVTFTNKLASPAEDITEEVEAEGDEHQLFFTGTAVNGPAAVNAGAVLEHAYDDVDAEGLPVGLANTVTTRSGSGKLTVTLRHLPPVSESPVKTAQLAANAAQDGLGALPGDSDASVTFDVTVR